MTQELIEAKFRSLQLSIIEALESADGVGKFGIDEWKHEQGGGGITRVISNGRIIEKGGVNFSAVEGVLSPTASKALQIEATNFYATGVSIVIHPKHPLIPIIHMNVRYFEVDGGYYWFGGGIDLTPHYVNKPEARFFHGKLKEVCDQFDPEFYSKFKDWADDYFFLPHRNETRGIGGLFFDRLSSESTGLSKDKIAEFVLAIGETFAPTYTALMLKNIDRKFTDAHRKWQSLRRGRYVEFNLAYDRGTRFGLETGGRTESILMSLPTTASWEYNYTPIAGSSEMETLNLLKKGIDWLTIE
jgi:coproporphyrinogen III oxidase